MLFKLYIVLFKLFIHCSFIGLSIKTPNAMAQIHASWDENWLGWSFFHLMLFLRFIRFCWSTDRLLANQSRAWMARSQVGWTKMQDQQRVIRLRKLNQEKTYTLIGLKQLAVILLQTNILEIQKSSFWVMLLLLISGTYGFASKRKTTNTTIFAAQKDTEKMRCLCFLWVRQQNLLSKQDERWWWWW